MRNRIWLPLSFVAVAALGGILLHTLTPSASAQATRPDPDAVERARQTVQMLDGVYKNAIVLITDKFVNDTDDFPAGSIAVMWFDAVSQGGTHQVRLIDATGEPFDPDNAPRDEFEREGIRQLRAGEAYYEEVVTVDGRPQLRAVTAVPVVMEKCVMCHPNYADAGDGVSIGAISYTMPIQ